MAATAINNIDGLAAVPGFDAADEALIKAALPKLLSFDRAVLSPMLFGAISAEAFIDAEVGDLRGTLSVATVAKLDLYNLGSNKVKIQAFVWRDGAWSQAVTFLIVDNAQFSEYVTP